MKNKPTRQPAACRQKAFWAFCSSILKMEAAHCFKTSVRLDCTVQHQVTEDSAIIFYLFIIIIIIIIIIFIKNWMLSKNNNTSTHIVHSCLMTCNTTDVCLQWDIHMRSDIEVNTNIEGMDCNENMMIKEVCPLGCNVGPEDGIIHNQIITNW
jgi:hypothetical protein